MMDEATILIIEDDSDILEVLSLYVQNAGYRVLTVDYDVWKDGYIDVTDLCFFVDAFCLSLLKIRIFFPFHVLFRKKGVYTYVRRYT